MFHFCVNNYLIRETISEDIAFLVNTANITYGRVQNWVALYGFVLAVMQIL